MTTTRKKPNRVRAITTLTGTFYYRVKNKVAYFDTANAAQHVIAYFHQSGLPEARGITRNDGYCIQITRAEGSTWAGEYFRGQRIGQRAR